jgi:drug/metabolite transporter (DMT)-like permease
VTRRGWLWFGVLCLVWGFPYLLIKIADTGVSVPVLVFARTAVGAAVLLPLAVRRGALDTVRRHWLPLAGFAASEIVLPWWLLSAAERRLTSSLTGLLIAAVPIIGVLIARLLGGAEQLGVLRWLGLVIGLAGVAVLAVPDLGGGNTWAITEVMLVSIGYSIAPIIAARKLAGVPNLLTSATCLTAAAIVYLPAAIVTWPAQRPSGGVLGALAGLGIICTALAFLVFFQLLREVGPARGMVFTYVTPGVSVAAGVLVLGEPLTGSIVIAFALIIAGCVLATLRPRSRARAEYAGSSAASRSRPPRPR